MTQKIVINVCHGGFGLSETAELKYLELSGKPLAEMRYEIARSDPYLVQVVEQLGAAANTDYSELKVVEIPKYVKWHIQEYDGLEWVAEDHRTWN
jgi:hypothetical protein